MTRKPSSATRAKHERLLADARAKWDIHSSALTTWAIANGHGQVRWNDLLPIARREAPVLVEAEEKASRNLASAEDAAITAWTHYRGTYGLLFPVSH